MRVRQRHQDSFDEEGNDGQHVLGVPSVLHWPEDDGRYRRPRRLVQEALREVREVKIRLSGMKNAFLLLFLFSIVPAQLLDEKKVVLPVFVPKSMKTEDVQNFVEKNRTPSQKIVKKCVKRDALGRKTLDSVFYAINESKEDRMQVVVSYLCERNVVSNKIFGRYESGSSKNERRYWFNDVEMDERQYLKNFNDLIDLKDFKNLKDLIDLKDLKNLKNHVDHQDFFLIKKDHARKEDKDIKEIEEK